MPDSDDTLVEDSEESDVTLTSSPPLKRVIIDDSDSNPPSSQEKLSNLSIYNFPHDTLHPLPEEHEDALVPLEKSFSQVPGMEHKSVDEEIKSSFFAQIGGHGMKTFPSLPSKQKVLENMEKLLMKDDDDDDNNSDSEEQIDDLVKQLYSQIKETSQKDFEEEVQSSFFAQINTDRQMTPPPPIRSEFPENTKKHSILADNTHKSINYDIEGKSDKPFERSNSQILEAGQKGQHDEAHSSSATHRLRDTVKPKFSDPEIQEILKSIIDYDPSKCENGEPYFSNREDAVGLPARYQTTIRSRLEEWQRLNGRKLPFAVNDLVNKGLIAYRKDENTVTITPLILPPSREDVIARWKERNKLKKAEKEQEKKKKRDMDSQHRVSQKTEGSSNSSTIVDQSLSISKLFKDNYTNDSSKHLGISCGDIEGPSRATIVPADGNIGAKALASVNAKFITTYPNSIFLSL